MSHVLSSESNIIVLQKGVLDLCESKHISCTKDEIKVGVEHQLKMAIENNIAGTRYLTNENQLWAANLHIVLRAVNDLKSLKSEPTLETVLSEEDFDQIQTSRRRKEVRVHDRSFLVETVDDNERRAAHEIALKTPRQLWG